MPCQTNPSGVKYTHISIVSLCYEDNILKFLHINQWLEAYIFQHVGETLISKILIPRDSFFIAK